MRELTDEYSQAFFDIRRGWDDYYGIRGVSRRKYGQELPERLKDSLDRAKINLEHRQDSILEDYVKRNPRSYVALWETIAEFSSGYKKEFDSVLWHFSTDLKRTSTYSIFTQRLASARVACIGCRFPVVSLCNLQHLDRQSSVSDFFSKYTLIDFWFSHCTPCIEQFPFYKRIYETYSNKGFQIVGISTDKSSQINDWKGVIQSHQLRWPQFLDADGSVARLLSISVWPSNFLLDEKGTILLRNVDPQQLEQFLKANLKQF
jgi:thiol-disulfide isomerase/thioredoxin